MHGDILVDEALLRYDGLPRGTEWVVAGFRNRRLIEAVLGIHVLIIENRVGRLGPLVLGHRHLFNILTCWRVARVMVVIAVRFRDCIVRVGLIILQLIGMVLAKRRVEIFLLICSVIC
jgi:hypothetical protein